MLQSLARFSGSEPLIHTGSSADLITITSEFRFSVHTASEGRLYGPQAAIGTMITIPVVILGMLIQKHLVKGFSFGTIRK